MCQSYLQMFKNKALVDGSCGLIGSEVSIHFHRTGYEVLGVDSNQRAVFFGPGGGSHHRPLSVCAINSDTNTAISTSVTEKESFDF